MCGQIDFRITLDFLVGLTRPLPEDVDVVWDCTQFPELLPCDALAVPIKAFVIFLSDVFTSIKRPVSASLFT